MKWFSSKNSRSKVIFWLRVIKFNKAKRWFNKKKVDLYNMVKNYLKWKLKLVKLKNLI